MSRFEVIIKSVAGLKLLAAFGALLQEFEGVLGVSGLETYLSSPFYPCFCGGDTEAFHSPCSIASQALAFKALYSLRSLLDHVTQ